MPLHESECIVLKSYDLAEADRIVVLYSRDLGIIRGVAKGVKRLKSRFGSALEPFSVVNLEFFEKEDRELVSIQKAELVRSAFLAASSPLYLAVYSHIAELLAEFAPPRDPNETLYRMTRACLEVNLDNIVLAEAVRLYFDLWLLKLGGYLPDWRTCFRCRRSFSAMEAAWILADLHLACGNCSPKETEMAVPPAVRQVFHNVQKLSPEVFVASADPNSDAVRILSGQLARMIRQVSGLSSRKGSASRIGEVLR